MTVGNSPSSALHFTCGSLLMASLSELVAQLLCWSKEGNIILQGMTFDASDDDVMMEMSVYGN